MQHLLGFVLLIVVCWVASNLVLTSTATLLMLVAAALAMAAYLGVLVKAPYLAFPILLVAATEVIGIVPYERWPILRLGFGSISILDGLILVPFLWLKAQVLSGQRKRTRTAFDGPIMFMYVMLLVAIFNGLFLQGTPYREVIRFGRSYLYYLAFFILVDSLRDARSVRRLLQVTTGIVAVGCALQILEFWLGVTLAEATGLATREMVIGYQVLTIVGQRAARFLTKTGNFALVLFFVSFFLLLRARRQKHQLMAFAFLILSAVSIFLTYGRTLVIMMAVGLVAGYLLEQEYRRKYLIMVSIAAATAILLLFALGLYGGDQGNLLMLIWERVAGIRMDVLHGRDTFGFRVSLAAKSLSLWIRTLPFGPGLGVGGVWDIGLLSIFLHFGILGPIFYFWIIRNAIRRFAEVHRLPLSEEARIIVRGFICYGVGVLAVLPIQDPFPEPLGILLVVFVLALLEAIARFDPFPKPEAPPET